MTMIAPASQAQAQSIQSMSSQFQDVRAQLESDEQLKILMAGLRGSNLNDSDYAEEGVNMVMVEVSLPCCMHHWRSWSVLPHRC